MYRLTYLSCVLRASVHRNNNNMSCAGREFLFVLIYIATTGKKKKYSRSFYLLLSPPSIDIY